MFMRRKDKDSHPNGWTQEMLDIFVDKFSTTHSYGSLALLITQCVRKVEITRPEDREKYFLETATFFGCLYVPKESPLQSVSVRIHTEDKIGLLRIPEHCADNEARFLGYIALANHSQEQETVAVLHVTLPGGDQVRNGLVNSLTLARKFGASYFPIHIWGNFEILRGKSILEALKWERSNFPLIERCRFDQTLDLSVGHVKE